MRNKQKCECAHERDLTRQGTLNGEEVTRSGAEKAKRGNDKQSGDVTRSRKRGDARSDFGAYKARGRGSGRARRHVTGRERKEARYREGCIRRDVIAVGEERHVTDVTSA